MRVFALMQVIIFLKAKIYCGYYTMTYTRVIIKSDDDPMGWHRGMGIDCTFIAPLTAERKAMSQDCAAGSRSAPGSCHFSQGRCVCVSALAGFSGSWKEKQIIVQTLLFYYAN